MTTARARQLRQLLVDEKSLRCGNLQDKSNVLSTSLPAVLQDKTMERLALAANPDHFLCQIKKECLELHNAFGPVSEAFKSRLESLSPETIFLRVSHQPNTLCQLNVVGLTILANKLSLDIERSFNAKCQVLFICIDYDVAGDQRFRGPRLPGIKEGSVFGLNGAVPKFYHETPALFCPSVPKSTLQAWSSSLMNSASFWSRNIGKIKYTKHSLVAAIEHEMKEYSRGNSICEQNIFHLMDLVLNKFSLPVIFARASSLFAKSAAALKSLLEMGERNEQLMCYLDKSIWRFCNQCLDRSEFSLRGMHNSDSYLCEKCRANRLKSNKFRSYYSWERGIEPVPKFAPKVILDDLLDFVNMPKSIGIHYAGGTEHLFNSRSLACDLGLELAPDFVWEPLRVVESSDSSEESLAPGISPPNAKTIGDNEATMEFSKGKFPCVFLGLCFGYNYLANRIEQSALA